LGPRGSLKVVGDIARTSYPELELEERRRVLVLLHAVVVLHVVVFLHVVFLHVVLLHAVVLLRLFLGLLEPE